MRTEFDIDKARLEVEDRNQLRKDFQMPLLDIEAEIEKMRKVHFETEFNHFMNTPVSEKIEVEVLEEMRREMGNPNWKPTGPINGGYAFSNRYRERMRKLFMKIPLTPCKN